MSNPVSGQVGLRFTMSANRGWSLMAISGPVQGRSRPIHQEQATGSPDWAFDYSFGASQVLKCVDYKEPKLST